MSTRPSRRRLHRIAVLASSITLLAGGLVPAAADGEPATEGDFAPSGGEATALEMVAADRSDTPAVTDAAIALDSARQQPAAAPAATVPSDPGSAADPVLEGLAGRVIPVDEADLIGFTWNAEAAPDRVELRSHNGADGWGAWGAVEMIEESSGGPQATEAVWIGGADQVEVRASRDGQDASASLEAELITSQPVAADETVARDALGGAAALSTSASSTDSSVGVGAPRVISRAGWGADESWVRSDPSYARETKAVVLHHTAGSNAYTSADSASIVRGIYRYHTQTLGWNDIGYNALVDRYGQIFEGRRGGLNRSVIGAHALGSNTGTFGVSMMGDNTTVAPTSAQLAAVADITAWKMSGSYIVDATEQVTVDAKQQYRLFGHRDARQGSTDCPGDRGHAQLPFLRKIVNERLATYRSAAYANYLRDGGQKVFGTVTDSALVVGGAEETRYSSGLVQRIVGGRAVVLDSQGAALTSARLNGGDRYAVSAAASRQAYPKGAGTVMIASGEVFSDALATSPQAVRSKGPLLLARRWTLPSAIRTELQRLAPHTIIVAGGTGTIDDSVIAQIRQATGARVTRVSARDRYQLAAAQAQPTGPLFIANGEQFPDALSASSGAALSGGSVLLTRGGNLAGATASVIRENPSRPVYIVGGPATVAPAVEEEIRSLGARPVRIGGRDRFEVSVNVAKTFRAQGSTTVHLASGHAFADALSAVSASGAVGAPTLLARQETMTADARLYLRTAPTTRAVIVGGTTTLWDTVAAR